MARLGKPYHVKIYPPVGQKAAEGHDFVFRRLDEWEADVFRFLDRCVGRRLRAPENHFPLTPHFDIVPRRCD